MNQASVLRVICCFALSLIGAAGAYTWDMEARSNRTQAQALQVARVLGAQIQRWVESESGTDDKNITEWAIDGKSDSSSPWTLSVYPARLGAVNSPEVYSYDHDKNELDFARTLSQEDDSGVRIRVSAQNLPGFLGFYSPWNQGIFLATIAVMIFLATWAVAGLFVEVSSRTAIAWRVARKPRENRKKTRERWESELKEIVLGIGMRLKEVLKDARDLVGALIRSHEAMITVINRAKEIERKASAVKDSATDSAQWMEAVSRLPKPSATNPAANKDWDSALEALRALQLRCARDAQALHQEVQPLVEDTQRAANESMGLLDRKEKIVEHIHQTHSALGDVRNPRKSG